MNSRTPELMLQAVQKLAANPDYFLEQQSERRREGVAVLPSQARRWAHRLGNYD